MCKVAFWCFDLAHLILTRSNKKGTFIAPFLQIRKLRQERLNNLPVMQLVRKSLGLSQVRQCQSLA